MDTSKIVINSLENSFVDILRLDLTDRYISGNKWFKLKYNLEKAVEEGHTHILTFGGAYSNHIYATAAAASEYGLKSIGIIRGERADPLNPTLQFASSRGMKLHYIPRDEYRRKNDPDFINTLQATYGSFFYIPEGGSNELALKGMEEMVNKITENYDLWVVPVGTGGTMAGMISALNGKSEVLGISVLKGAIGLDEEVKRLVALSDIKSSNWTINHEYHFGGYAKFNKPLYNFITTFFEKYGILLDPVYTGKMMFGLSDMLENKKLFSNKKILAIHTGGLQGWGGMASRYSFIDPSFPFH